MAFILEGKANNLFILIGSSDSGILCLERFDLDRHRLLVNCITLGMGLVATVLSNSDEASYVSRHVRENIACPDTIDFEPLNSNELDWFDGDISNSQVSHGSWMLLLGVKVNTMTGSVEHL